MSLEEAKFCNLSTLIHCHSYFLLSKINISVFLEKHTSKTIHYQKNEIMTFYKKKTNYNNNNKNPWKWCIMEVNLIL